MKIGGKKERANGILDPAGKEIEGQKKEGMREKR